ncbi:hypothetical protein LCGC14_2299180, partial [marine sediment metagenome]
LLIIEKLIQNQLLLFLITSTLSLGIFFIFLLIFGELKREDLHFFFQLTKFSNYKNSLKEEFSIE